MSWGRFFSLPTFWAFQWFSKKPDTTTFPETCRVKNKRQKYSTYIKKYPNCKLLYLRDFITQTVNTIALLATKLHSTGKQAILDFYIIGFQIMLHFLLFQRIPFCQGNCEGNGIKRPFFIGLRPLDICCAIATSLFYPFAVVSSFKCWLQSHRR